MSVPSLEITKAWPSRELEHERQLFRAQFSPDGKFVAAGGQDKLVHLWELEKDERKSLDGHKTWVSSLVFHPKEKKLFTAEQSARYLLTVLEGLTPHDTGKVFDWDGKKVPA